MRRQLDILKHHESVLESSASKADDLAQQSRQIDFINAQKFQDQISLLQFNLSLLEDTRAQELATLQLLSEKSRVESALEIAELQQREREISVALQQAGARESELNNRLLRSDETIAFLRQEAEQQATR